MENLYEWWQLFDPTTCRYYYYNIANQRTAWHLPPNESSTSMSSLASTTTTSLPLASRLVSLLIKNHSLLNSTSTNDLKILYDNLRRENGGDGSNNNNETDFEDKFLRLFLSKNLSTIQNSLMKKVDDEDRPPPKSSQMQSLIKTKPTTSSNTASTVSVPLNAAMSSLTNLSPNVNTNVSASQKPQQQSTTQRRLLPRTNPNYVNVDLIDSNNGKTTIKNTYVKLQDLNGRCSLGVNGGNGGSEKENTNDEEEEERKPKMTTISSSSSAFNSLRRSTTTTNEFSSDLYQQATLLLLSILKNSEKGEKSFNLEGIKKTLFLLRFLICKNKNNDKSKTTGRPRI
jgi:hypothetical protein